MFRMLADPKGKKKMKDSFRKLIKEALLDEPGPDIVVCDEGHLLKNCKSMLSLAVSNIGTHRRIVLTGTPLQNNLVEYHTMMNFVKPNLLGTLNEFTNRFVNPIKNGQHADSTDSDVKTMKRRAHVLHGKLEGCVQRCDYLILAPYLPPKYEYIINIKLSDKQELLYKHYLENVVDGDLTVRRKNLLKYYAELVKIWSHPIALTISRNKTDDYETSEDEAGSLKDFVVDESEEECSKSSDSGAGTGDEKATRKTRAQAAIDPDPPLPDVSEVERLSDKWWNAIFKTKSEMTDVEISGKLVVLQQILKTCESIGDKVLVFSQYLSSLDIIEEFLVDWDKEAVEKAKDADLTFPLNGENSRWRRNIEYFRIDGQTKVSDRHRDCETFNKKSGQMTR
ncbi:Transcriptional regulator ATRX [Orchesella cincta]|uniref:Transcriptional regulator ATRX n=1 Tax=Orchesella cincta TaxID=48709 RepID=A0A1D2MUK7_ORCCI|nr:Transcriptional regulator ATRX [Orchesella cincta]